VCNLAAEAELCKEMSKKDKKIKSLKKELKDLKAEVRKLKSASARRRKSKMTKALGKGPKPERPAPTLAKIEESPDVSSETKGVITRIIGQR
jgi:predicted RNase H-like nuclease (RuvC/YqgF family)